jgi:hypothetical protein
MEVTASTIKGILGLVIPDNSAATLVAPAATPVTKPAEEMEAVAGVVLVQVTSELMSAVDPSEYVPIASNCSVAPNARIAGDTFVTMMEDKDITVKSVDSLVFPSKTAVILVVPAATAVAVPSEFIGAIPEVLLTQVT